jgi:polar amino acid transport system permease protein
MDEDFVDAPPPRAAMGGDPLQQHGPAREELPQTIRRRRQGRAQAAPNAVEDPPAVRALHCRNTAEDDVQGTPLLMQLFLAYFGLGLLGINVSAWVAAGLALMLYPSAFLTEIWRGCVDAIPRGQWEAADSLALSFVEKMRHVVGPQALRIAVPPTVGFLVQVIKGTALASVIGFIELTKAGTMITNATFRPFTVYACVALMYFALCWPVSAASRKLERSFRRGH